MGSGNKEAQRVNYTLITGNCAGAAAVWIHEIEEWSCWKVTRIYSMNFWMLKQPNKSNAQFKLVELNFSFRKYLAKMLQTLQSPSAGWSGQAQVMMVMITLGPPIVRIRAVNEPSRSFGLVCKDPWSCLSVMIFADESPNLPCLNTCLQ